MAMTRKEFEAWAVRQQEKELLIPPGWWGAWRDVQGPRGERVRFTGSAWVVRMAGKFVSRHDSRAYAIRVARSLRSTLRR